MNVLDFRLTRTNDDRLPLKQVWENKINIHIFFNNSDIRGNKKGKCSENNGLQFDVINCIQFSVVLSTGCLKEHRKYLTFFSSKLNTDRFSNFAGVCRYQCLISVKV